MSPSRCFIFLTGGIGINIRYFSSELVLQVSAPLWLRQGARARIAADLRNSHLSTSSFSLHPLLVSASTPSRAHAKSIRRSQDTILPPEAVERDV